jgi:hypothetical protein
MMELLLMVTFGPVLYIHREVPSLRYYQNIRDFFFAKRNLRDGFLVAKRQTIKFGTSRYWSGSNTKARLPFCYGKL